MKNSTNLVVDSSVIVKWLNSENENYLDQANNIIKRVERGSISLIAPELAKFEVINALLNKKLDNIILQDSIAFLFRLRINFIPLDSEIAQEAASIALGTKITFYDASFLALAIKMEAKLITDNIKHQKVLPASQLQVVALKNYR